MTQYMYRLAFSIVLAGNSHSDFYPHTFPNSWAARSSLVPFPPQIPTTLTALNSKLCLLSAGALPCNVWAPALCTMIRKLSLKNSQSNQRTTHVCPFFQGLQFVLPCIQCQKTFVSYILPSFTIVYSGKASLILGTLLWPEVEITFCVYKNENY